MANVPLSTRFIGISENVNLEEKKSAVLNAETQPYTISDLVSTIGTGAQGPQGVQGPPGPLGPVGPAGLTWRGAWVSGTSYVANDAVGYNGASYFCILATSGTTNPSVSPVNWALLASQGAQGPQGVQGPTGPQGAGASQTLQQTVNLGNTIDDGEGTVLTINSSQVKIQDALGGKINIEYTTGNKPSIEFGIPSSGGLKTFLRTPDVQTGNRNINLPDASGTIALQTYKEFSGRIFQGSILQPITLTVFKNDFNQLPTVLNDFGSPYDFVISLENQFPQNKTSVKTNVERENIIVSYPDAADNSTVYFNSFDFAGEQAAPTSFTFEIRVYN
jgi:hypothetical protein